MRWSRRAGLPLARVLDLAIPLADALAAAHQKGVVHRDLKPANVMVSREGRVKVLDFGLARTADGGVGTATMAPTMDPISQVGMVVGTVPYMAPEQLRGAPVDARTDLFSLGILLYELATGARPFQGASSVEISSAILRDPPPSPSSLRADLPRDLARVLERCLEKDPERRIQTAKDVRNELELLRRSVDPQAPPQRPRRPEPAPKQADAPSVAVLPFANRSASADDEYFSDGLADELISVLVKIKGLKVAARTSSASFKGKDATIEDVGRALNVQTVVEGSVRKAGNRVRISVQLIKVDGGDALWSETYDRALDDIFAVQDDIAQSVVKELRTTLLGESPDSDASGAAKAEVQAAAQGRGANPESHRLLLEGRHFVEQMSDSGVARGCLAARAGDRDRSRERARLGGARPRLLDPGRVRLSPGRERHDPGACGDRTRARAHARPHRGVARSRVDPGRLRLRPRRL
jgi:TolB-like protein